MLKRIVYVMIISYVPYLLSTDNLSILNNTNETITIILRYEGHGKIDDQTKTVESGKQIEYELYTPGCILKKITIFLATDVSKSLIIEGSFKPFIIVNTNGLLKVNT